MDIPISHQLALLSGDDLRRLWQLDRIGAIGGLKLVARLMGRTIPPGPGWDGWELEAGYGKDGDDE